MIKWIEYDRTNPPHLEQETAYLVTDGNRVDIGWFSDEVENEEPRWYVPDLSPICSDHVTHWAKINLPGEVSSDV
ncbi:hypothetical protein ACX93W_26810 [Paenibacillus sp. CAU 1782]